MFVSAEIITMIASAVAIVAAIGGVFAWGMKRIDAKFEKVDARFDRVDARFERVEDRLSRVEHELTEVKIAVARLEGPPRHLIPVR